MKYLDIHFSNFYAFYFILLCFSLAFSTEVGGSDKSGHSACVWPEGKAFSISPLNLMFSSVQFSSVAQSCPTLWDPMNCSVPGLPVHHELPEFTQTHVHWVVDAIQPSHPLLSPFPPAPNPSQHQGLFQWVNLMLALDFSQMPFITIRKFSFIPSLLRVVSWMNVGFYQIPFLCLLRLSYYFFLSM